jgi:hypothetical protein
MTENKTGDFAQYLPDSLTVQPTPHLTKTSSESAFKSKTPIIVAPLDVQKFKEKETKESVSHLGINHFQIASFTNFTPTFVKNMVNNNEYKGPK